MCFSKINIISSDNGLSPGRRQAIIWTNSGMLLVGLLGTKFSEILIDIYIFPFKKMHLKMTSAKSRPSCLGLSVLTEMTGAWMITTNNDMQAYISYYRKLTSSVLPNTLVNKSGRQFLYK